MVRTEVEDPQQIGSGGSSTSEHDERRVEPIHKRLDSVGGKHRTIDSSSGRTARSLWPPTSPKRIDSLNTAATVSTAEMSNRSFDSFALKSSGDSFLSQYEPGSPAAFFQQSFKKINLDKIDSRLPMSNPPLSLSGGASYIQQQSNAKLQRNQKKDSVIGKEVSAGSSATSTVESFRDSYRKQLEKKLRGGKEEIGPSATAPATSSGASFFAESYRKLEKKLNVAGESDAASTGPTYSGESYLKLEKKDSDLKQEVRKVTGDDGSEDSEYGKYFKEAYRELEKAQEEEPALAYSASCFKDSSNGMVLEKQEKNEATSSLPQRSSPKRCQHVVSESTLVSERGYSAYARKVPPQHQDSVYDSRLELEPSIADVADTTAALDPYQQLKRLMREGMGKVSEGLAHSMAETRLSIARQASRRGSLRQQTIEHRGSAAKDISDMDRSGHSIDMSGHVGRISPPLSPIRLDRPPSMGPIPVMEEDSPSRGEPSQNHHSIIHSPQHQDIEVVDGLSGRPTGDSASSVGAAELFAQFHATNLDSQLDLKPGAYTAEGPPGGNHPAQWTSETASRLEPPQRSQWSGRQRSSRRSSNFGIWWGLSRFSRRSFLQGGESAHDFPTGALQTEEVSRRNALRGSRSSSRRLVGIRMARSSQDDVTEREFQLEPIEPPELPAIPGTLGETMLIPDPLADPHSTSRSLEEPECHRQEKKRFRQTRKAFSKFCRCLQHCINVFVSYT